MNLVAILVASTLPWLVATGWFVSRHGRSLVDGRATPTQASQLRSFGVR